MLRLESQVKYLQNFSIYSQNNFLVNLVIWITLTDELKRYKEHYVYSNLPVSHENVMKKPLLLKITCM